MIVNPHLKYPIDIKNPSRLDSSGTGIVALHGRNQEPEYIEAILGRLGWESLPYIAPQAHEKSWYPGKFMDATEVNETGLNHSVEIVDQCISEFHKKGLKPEQIIILGFSQGACLASEYLQRNPGGFKAVICYTGGLPGPEGITFSHDGDLRQTPVFISTSEVDEWVPPGRVRETARLFEKQNAAVNMVIYNDRVHEVCDDEIRLVNQMINPHG